MANAAAIQVSDLRKHYGAIQKVMAAGVQSTSVPSGFAQSFPGMLVQFSVFGLMNAAIVLVLERQSGALRRLLTTPISKAGIIAGKLISTFTALFLQGLILVVVGHGWLSP